MAKRLNKGVDFIWPLVRQKAYDKVNAAYGRVNASLSRMSYELHEAHKDIEELERGYYARSARILPFPSGKMVYDSRIEPDPYIPHETRYSFNIEPLRGGRIEYNLPNQPDYTEHVKELLIRQIGELWKEKGEAEARKFLFNEQQQIYKVSKY